MAEKQLIYANDVYSLFDKSGFARLHVADIDTIPRVDAVEVVRCRDCKWFAENNGGEWYGCWLFSVILENEQEAPREDDFCSCGKRKEGEGNG